jgi:hypothetical protein
MATTCVTVTIEEGVSKEVADAVIAYIRKYSLVPKFTVHVSKEK